MSLPLGIRGRLISSCQYKQLAISPFAKTMCKIAVQTPEISKTLLKELFKQWEAEKLESLLSNTATFWPKPHRTFTLTGTTWNKQNSGFVYMQIPSLPHRIVVILCSSKEQTA